MLLRLYAEKYFAGAAPVAVRVPNGKMSQRRRFAQNIGDNRTAEVKGRLFLKQCHQALKHFFWFKNKHQNQYLKSKQCEVYNGALILLAAQMPYDIVNVRQ